MTVGELKLTHIMKQMVWDYVGLVFQNINVKLKMVKKIGKDEAMSDGIRGQAGKVATRAGMI